MDHDPEGAFDTGLNQQAEPSREALEATHALSAVTTKMVAGEERPQQHVMSEAVGEALATGTHLVVQAGTGTGKSLAYLIPALLSKKKVVVATATKALQDQLAEKDLPLVADGLGIPVSFAVLKGRSNYICRQRITEVGQGGIQLDLSQSTEIEVSGDVEEAYEPVPEGLVDQVRNLLVWSETTKSGDRGELEFEPSPKAWGMVSVGPRECPGAFNCPSGGRCFAEAARDQAAAADIVIVNTHLYGAHLASGGAVLPEHDVVVFDETHELEEVMTSSLGVEITPGRFRALVASARPLVRDTDADHLSRLAAAGEELGLFLADRIGIRVLHDAADTPADDRSLVDLLARCGELTGRVTDALRQSEATPSLLPTKGGTSDASSRRTRTVGAASHLTDDLHRLLGLRDGEVAWVDGSRRYPRLRLSPIDVGPALAASLWGEVTAVLTSATVPPRLIERVGLADFETRQIDVGSPFDYRAHALLYVARHLPDRRAPEAEAALHEELALLIDAAGGRTLALFTSRRATDEAAAALAPRLPYTLLLQGELPKGRLLEVFAEDETSCLFATLGFWQGVDIPGRALSLVTLDRLPFPRPDDPLIQARRELAGSGAFSLVDLPRAATLLAQGSGRLIRSAEDRGVVAVLDSRLATASYRATLLAALPPMRRSVDRGEVEAFLQSALA
jgi:ATP-dependent DNA helicase DinG